MPRPKRSPTIKALQGQALGSQFTWPRSPPATPGLAFDERRALLAGTARMRALRIGVAPKRVRGRWTWGDLCRWPQQRIRAIV